MNLNMSFHSKNDCKLKFILNEEMKIKKDLEKINNNKKIQNSNVCDFNAIFLQNKINKLHHEIKNIMTGKPDNDNNIA